MDPTFDARVKEAYDGAMKAGLWKGKYASVNHHEYFAEGVQSWFDNNRENDHDHNHVNTRAELLEYDPGLAALCREVFGDTELKYTKPDHAAHRPHGRLRSGEGADVRVAGAAEAGQSGDQGKGVARDAAANGNCQPPTSALRTSRLIPRCSRWTGSLTPVNSGSTGWANTSGAGARRPTSPSKRRKPAATGRDLVRNDPATGDKEIVVPAERLRPGGTERAA